MNSPTIDFDYPDDNFDNYNQTNTSSKELIESQDRSDIAKLVVRAFITIIFLLIIGGHLLNVLLLYLQVDYQVDIKEDLSTFSSLFGTVFGVVLCYYFEKNRH